MSDKNPPRKIGIGRGRGRPSKSEGPWARSKKLDESDSQEVRPPKKGEEFVLSEKSFPPLPGATVAEGQFDDNEVVGGKSLSNGHISNGKECHENGSLESEESNSPIQIPGKECEPNVNTGEVKENANGQITGKEFEPNVNPGEVKENANGQITGKEFEPNVNTGEVKENANGQITGKEIPKILNSEDNIENPNDSMTVNIETSSLSPFAAEFVPKGLDMNPNAQDFVPTNGNFEEVNNNPVHYSSVSSINVEDTNAVLGDLEETVAFCYSKLIETPALYDELMGVVMPHFIKYMENPELPIEIVRTLYNYAIQDTRFVYFGVKILIHLVNTTTTEDNTVLRDALLRHTQAEVEGVQLADPSVSCTSKIEPFLTFLSELYFQLKVGGKRLSMVGFALVETLRKLLFAAHIPIKERLRLVVNMSKLTGLSLDRDNPSLLDGLFAEVEVMMENEKSNINSDFIKAVGDVIILRNLRWGRVEPHEEEMDNNLATNGNQGFPHSNGYDSASEASMVDTSGVFYGPDGQPIDQEEQLFLEVETNALNHIQIGDQGEPSPTSEDYDEAYEEFLRTVPGYSEE